MTDTVFRIAHVSDLHLAKRPEEIGVDMEDQWWSIGAALLPGLFKASFRPWMTSYGVEYLRALSRSLAGKSYYNSKPYDAYIFSGDLATTGYPQDLAVASSFMRGKSIIGNQFLTGSFCPPPTSTVLLPGNHDRYEGRWLIPRSIEFESSKNFGGDWKQFSRFDSSSRSTVNSQVIEKGEERLGVVSVDFSFHREFPFFLWYLGQGLACPTVIKDLVSQTEALKSNGLPVIWVMHFPPLIRSVKRFLRLRDAQKVGDAALKCGVNVIFCGHTHEASYESHVETSSTDFNGVRIICASSATQAGGVPRSYFEVYLEVSQTKRPSVNVQRITEMVYKKLPFRRLKNKYSHRGEYCPDL